MLKKKGSAKNDPPTILESLDPMGEGVYVAIGDGLPNGEMKATFFASNEMPPLRAGADNMKRTLKISYASVANDNERLLHLLFRKTRKQRKLLKNGNTK